jgi:hypothetical protein
VKLPSCTCSKAGRARVAQGKLSSCQLTFIDLMTVFACQIECKGLREEMEWALISMRKMIEADKLATSVSELVDV